MRCNIAISSIVTFAIVLIYPAWAKADAQAKDPWAPLSFLVGDWIGGSGKPDDSSHGEASFTYDLKKKIIIRKNHAVLAPKPGEKSGVAHDDLMVIYQQPGGDRLRAMYFDDEGHVINYVVSFPDKQTGATFESDSNASGPRFRLTYELLKDGTVDNKFFIAPPGGEFKLYLSGVIKKRDGVRF